MGVLLGGLLLLWFLFTVQWPALFLAMSGIHTPVAALAALTLVLEFGIRALRWRIVLRPVVPDASIRLLFSATVVGAAANTLLPARAGDLARPLLVVRHTGARLATLLATNLVERVFDLVGLLFVFLLMLSVLPPSQGPEGELVNNLRLYGLMLGGVGVLGMAVLAAMAVRHSAIRHRLALLAQRLPESMRQPILRLLDGLVDGILAMRNGRDVALAIFFSLLLWSNGVFAIWLLFQAFSLDLPLGAACFTAVAIALTVVLPQAPGFVGVFHVAIEKTLVLWGLDVAPAKAFAIVFWGISFIPITAIGIMSMWREGLSLSGVLSPGAGTKKNQPGISPAHSDS